MNQYLEKYMSLKKTLGKILTYGFISTMALSGASSIQSCSPYKTISGKAEIVAWKTTEDKNYVEKLGLKINREQQNYLISFKTPQKLDSVFNYINNTNKIQLKILKEDLKKAKKEKKEENTMRFIEAIIKTY
jgi:hypothetical protein